MIIVGIDPGLRGAMAVIDTDNGTQSVYDCPTLGARTKPAGYNPVVMWMFLNDMRPDQVVIERQQAMPKQGVSSTFQTGYGYGLWIGLITAIGAPYTVVQATAWKKYMLAGLDRSNKNVSRMVAMRCFPTLADKLTRVGDDGRAEALLVAEYGRRTLAGKEAVLSTTPTTE